MDMMSNPGFVIDPEKSDEVYKAMFLYLKYIYKTIINYHILSL